MRISNTPLPGTGSPSLGGDRPLRPSAENARPSAFSAPGGGVQFGQQGGSQTLASPAKDAQSPNLLGLVMKRLLGGDERTAPARPLTDVTPATRTASATATSDATASNPATTSPEAQLLDDSKYSSPRELERWAPLVADLPPEQREQAAKELNRPIAAAMMATEKGPDAAKAMKFINDNPALKTAVDTGKHGGKADGKITDGDLKAFAKKMQGAADNADKGLANYQKDHPDADPQSLQMVRSASLLQANGPLANAASPKHAAGAEGETKVDQYMDAEGLKALQDNNPGLAGPLKQASKTWSQPGLLNMLDQGGLKGRDLATHGPDQKFDAANISNWIKNQAPTNGGEFAGMLSDAATLNAVAGTDISKLGKEVFEQPENYSGAQKAAVMVKLQQTQQSVVAGSDLRKTGKTEEALAQKIGQLQDDPDVQAYMNQAIPSQERALVASDPSLEKAVKSQLQNVVSGQALRNDMNSADKSAKKDANPDYSTALGGLSAQLQMQQDLLGPEANLPTAAQVVGNQPDVQGKLQQSYVNNFSEGGSLKQLLGQKKADASQSLQTSDARKAAYDAVLPQSFVQGQQASYVDATVGQLQQSKKGRELLENAGDGAGRSGSVSDAVAPKNKAQQVKDAYDNTKQGLSSAKDGVDAVRKLAGREASAGLGRMAGSIGGRIAGAVAGEAAGLAAASAIGAAAGPVGWVIDAAMSIGFGIAAIIEAVKKHTAQKHFDHNVDPTLEQFGIPKAH